MCEILEEWGISTQKVNAILTDNGSNMVAAFKEWVDELQDASTNGTEDQAESSEEESSQSPRTLSDGSDDEQIGDGDPSDVGSSEADKNILEFEEQEGNHDIAFSHQKRLSCLSYTTACSPHTRHRSLS